MEEEEETKRRKGEERRTTPPLHFTLAPSLGGGGVAKHLIWARKTVGKCRFGPLCPFQNPKEILPAPLYPRVTKLPPMDPRVCGTTPRQWGAPSAKCGSGAARLASTTSALSGGMREAPYEGNIVSPSKAQHENLRSSQGSGCLGAKQSIKVSPSPFRGCFRPKRSSVPNNGVSTGLCSFAQSSRCTERTTAC